MTWYDTIINLYSANSMWHVQMYFTISMHEIKLKACGKWGSKDLFIDWFKCYVCIWSQIKWSVLNLAPWPSRRNVLIPAFVLKNPIFFLHKILSFWGHFCCTKNSSSSNRPDPDPSAINSIPYEIYKFNFQYGRQKPCMTHWPMIKLRLLVPHAWFCRYLIKQIQTQIQLIGGDAQV